ncbi:SDR family NAD(P)-dependent oxidoreductase [Amycolatopsis sp. GM8]|uniref:SDR family NAD(P)-dependent oxidoreductase n=1 Tax=Amycolatopsis sp. GM8 TaxID=2896530 RepID=UPI001F38083B|nr:SDR family NAD(P)-dependent oxidoreductase [Amycolatopsis sp. GM8]
MTDDVATAVQTDALDPGLRGARALVVGVGPGIGLECARLLGALGAHVGCVDQDPDRAATAAAELAHHPGEAAALVGDVRRPDEVRRLVGAALDAFGGLDVVINVVGHGGPAATVAEMPDEVWHQMLDINLQQQFLVAREVLKPMMAQRRGSLVFISSVNGLGSSPVRAAYGVAKAGLVSLARSLAIEGAEYGVRVNTVAPGPTRTPRRQHLAEGALAELYRAEIPLGRLAEPYEVARAAAFLASDLAGYITGQTLVIDGGASVKYPVPAGN